MVESLINISILGFSVGFLLSVPVAGPISIMILSNALKGKKRFCLRASVGSAVADFIYVFIAVFGITKILTLISSYLSYILFFGSFFIMYVAWKIISTKLDENTFEAGKNSKLMKKEDLSGGLRTGFFINFLNPTLFFGWMTSTFVALSIATSLGFNTGGMGKMIDHTIKTIDNHTKTEMLVTDNVEETEFKQTTLSKYFPLILSLSYAIFLALGSMVWFFILTILVIRYRHKIKFSVLTWTIRGLGIVLLGLGVYLIVVGIAKL